MHAYMSTIVDSMGLKHARERIGAHPKGMDPKAWRETVADDAGRAVAGEFITLALGRDMILAADLMVAEMLRYPQISDWQNDLYDEAAYHGHDPEIAEAEIRGEPVHTPHDDFIQAFLADLIAEVPAHA